MSGAGRRPCPAARDRRPLSPPGSSRRRSWSSHGSLSVSAAIESVRVDGGGVHGALSARRRRHSGSGRSHRVREGANASGTASGWAGQTRDSRDVGRVRSHCQSAGAARAARRGGHSCTRNAVMQTAAFECVRRSRGTHDGVLTEILYWRPRSAGSRSLRMRFGGGGPPGPVRPPW